MNILSLESDKVIQMMKDWQSAQTSEILKDLIEEDSSSELKEKMNQGVSYYKVENTEIMSKNFNRPNVMGVEYRIDAPNNKRKHGYFRIAVDQKVGYIDEPQFQIDNEKVKEQIAYTLGETFPDLLNDWERGASQKGVEYLHVYVNNDELDYVIFPATQIIPIYDTRFQKDLVSVIRYYPYVLKKGSDKKELYKVEVYTDKTIEFFEQDESEEYVFIESKPHFEKKNSVNGIEGLSWDKVPVIELANNTDKMSDLFLAKDLIDDYDLHKSVFSNDLESIQEVLLHIQGFDIQGKTKSEIAAEYANIKKNILALKMIVTNDENAKVDAIKQDIPHTAKDSHLDRTRKEIFTLLMGVDPQSVGDGNITNVVIKSRYLLLDMKSELLIAKLKKALRELLYFISKFAKNHSKLQEFNYKDVQISIGKNMLINDAEVIQNLIASGNLLSEETKIAKHPYVDDLDAELERINNEGEVYKSQLEQDE